MSRRTKGLRAPALLFAALAALLAFVATASAAAETRTGESTTASTVAAPSAEALLVKSTASFEPATGQLRPDVWQRWLDWDPVRMAPQYAEALATQRGIWIDAGVRDEWFLDLGATAFRETLRDLGIRDDVINFELFDGTHMGIDYRYPLSLAWMCHRLT